MHTLRFFVLCSDIPASPCASSCCRASYERGEYPESVAALEQAVQDVGADTNMGGDAQLWLGLAYQVGGWVVWMSELCLRHIVLLFCIHCGQITTDASCGGFFFFGLGGLRVWTTGPDCCVSILSCGPGVRTRTRRDRPVPPH